MAVLYRHFLFNYYLQVDFYRLRPINDHLLVLVCLKGKKFYCVLPEVLLPIKQWFY